MNSASRPRISVVMPMYNDAPDLPDCLDSILSQSMADFEIIAVDDASTDDTAGIAASYAARDSRIRLIRHEKNANSFQTRLTAFDRVEGDYIFCCDADDIIPPGIFDLMLDKAAKTGADVVHGRMRYHSGTEPRELIHWMEPFRVTTGRDFVLSMLRNARGWSVVGKLFSRRTLDRALPTFPRGRHWFTLDDLLGSCLLGLHAETYAGLRELAYYYRIPPVTHSVRSGGLEKWASDSLGIITFLEETINRLPDESALLAGVKGVMRNSITGILTEAAQSPEAFGIVAEKVRSTVLPEHVRWAEEQGLFDPGSGKNRGWTHRLGSALARFRERGWYETYLRFRIKLLSRRREREYRAANAQPN